MSDVVSPSGSHFRFYGRRILNHTASPLSIHISVHRPSSSHPSGATGSCRQDQTLVCKDRKKNSYLDRRLLPSVSPTAAVESHPWITVDHRGTSPRLPVSLFPRSKSATLFQYSSLLVPSVASSIFPSETLIPVCSDDLVPWSTHVVQLFDPSSARRSPRQFLPASKVVSNRSHGHLARLDKCYSPVSDLMRTDEALYRPLQLGLAIAMIHHRPS